MTEYRRLRTADFWDRIRTERQARLWFWRDKFDGKSFECPRCLHRRFWEMKTRPEVRKCRRCDKYIRLRAGTIMEHSKVPVLVWLRAVFLVGQDKRGVSATQLQRQLGLRTYRTAWRLLQRIREALRQRDERYKLSGTIEFDGADFGEQKDKGNKKVLVAVESKDWVDEHGKRKKRAGFAKVSLSRQSQIRAQQFVDAHIQAGSLVNTDASNAFGRLQYVEHDDRVMRSLPGRLESWLPWVHRWIQNAKAWLTGTYHGVTSRYLELYLAEYNYRFNRRHDPNAMFHRILTACALARPVRLVALCS